MNLESAKTGSSLYSQLPQPIPEGNHSQIDVFIFFLKSNRLSHSHSCFAHDSFSQKIATSFHLHLRGSFHCAGIVSRQLLHLLFPPCEGLLEVTEVLEGRCSVAFLVLFSYSLKQKSLGFLS